MGRLGDRIFGPPPARTAERVEKLRWVRRFYTRCGVPLVLMMVIIEAAIGGLGWVMVVFVGCLVLELIGLASITRQIRRLDQSRPRARANRTD
jgi:hypothetical protein